jgi:GT2 family glycosyltransferase
VGDRGADTIAAIVVAHDGGQDLLDCVASLVAQVGVDVEVVVVDNASSDGSIGQLKERFGRRVFVVHRGANHGYAAGANAGRKATNAAWIGVFNQDLTLAPDCLSILQSAIRAWPTSAVASPLLRLTSAPQLVNAVGNDIHWTGVTWCHGAGSQASCWAGTVEVAGISGAAFVMTAEVFDDLGGLDEEFFMYMEDVDLSLRARSRGYSCLVACEAHALHDWQLAITPEKFERLEANRRIVWSRHLAGPRRRRALLIQAEAMGWIYAALRGRQHIRAKLRAARRRTTVIADPAGRERIEPWLSRRHPYELLFPGNPTVHFVGRVADDLFLRLAGIAASR